MEGDTMIKMRYTLVGCAVLGLIVAVPAAAGSIRCGSHIIQDGTRDAPGKYEVLKKCGEPTERLSDTWIYDKPGRSKRVLRFGPDGKLMRIE
jgi:hypothetical protein